jgi:hypothetical protein
VIVNNLNNDEVAEIISDLYVKGGVCPSCESKVKKPGGLSHYKNKEKEMGIYYVLCPKCYKKLSKMMQPEKLIRLELIQNRLLANINIYMASEDNDNMISEMLRNVVSRKNEKNSISELPTNNAWNRNDKDFFDNNENKKFRARRVFSGELEETYNNKPEMELDAAKKNISFAIIHKISDYQRTRAYVNDISALPWEDEDYVAALFQVLTNSYLTVNDIDKIYSELKAKSNSSIKT